jgi:hypothetical protein
VSRTPTTLSTEEQIVRRTLAWLGYDPAALAAGAPRGALLEREAPNGHVDPAEVMVLLVSRYDLAHCVPRQGDVVRCVGCHHRITSERDWVLERTLVMHPDCHEHYTPIIQRA